LVAGAVYYAMKSFTEIEMEKEKIVSTVLPGVSSDLNSAKQVPQLNEISNSINKQNPWQNGNVPDANTIARSQQQNVSNEEAEFQKLQAIINQSRQSQLESVVGKNPETGRKDFDKMAANLLRLSMIFSIPIFLSFLWGVFYFPAACAVAGYTRSFAAVLNPSVGLDTIKRLGFDYAKILSMCFVLGIFSIIVSYSLGVVFAPFDLPRMGNMPVKIVGSFFTFYFSIVFSVVLGYALYKNSDRLNLNRS
jgi:Fe2+ transport system protein B